MTTRPNIICLIAFVSLAVPMMAQQAGERLDSLVKTLNLKEVVVTAKKIRQSGDTISYTASSYMGKTDKTLEDLLRNMPGIEVKSDGQIIYNGQWINEFYIEGLDMLGSNYGVATKNIDAQDIGAVQILKDHQDVKMLQGVQRGSAPAMNIRLKKSAKGIWSSTINGALGSQPNISWDVAATLMNFSRKSQSISVYKTNNVGNDLRPEISAPTTYPSAYGTGILYPEKPSLPDKFAYRNESHSFSANQLFKLSEDKTLTFNLNYLYDREKRESTDETVYLSDSLARYVVNESNLANIRQHFISAHAVYKLNGSKSYLKNTISASASFPKGDGIINETILQKFSGHNVSVADNLKINYKKGNGGIADASFNISYTDKKGRLALPGDEFAQMITQRAFKTEGVASIVACRIPHFMFNLNGEVDLIRQQVINDRSIADVVEPVNLHTWQVGCRITPKLLWHNGQRFQWLVYVPMGILYYDSDESSWAYSKTFFSFRPYSNITYKSSDNLTLSLTTIVEEAMPSALSLMAQKRYMDYRTTMSNPNHIEATLNRTLKTSLNASYSNVLEMLFGSATLTYAKSRYSNSTGYDISDNVINYMLLPISTNSRIMQFDQTFSKGFFRWKSKVSEAFTIGRNKAEYIVNDTERNGKSNYLKINLSYTATFAQWLSFETSNDFTLSRAYTDGTAYNDTKRTFTNTSSVALSPCNGFNVIPSVMYYNNNYSSAYRNNVFLNCNFEFTLGTTIFSLQCSNLLDNSIFRRYNDNGIIRYSSEYKLRGRTIIFGVRLRIT